MKSVLTVIFSFLFSTLVFAEEAELDVSEVGWRQDFLGVIKAGFGYFG